MVTPGSVTLENVSVTGDVPVARSTGVTTLSVSSTGPTLPAGFQLGNGLYYEIASGATFSSVQVCIDYSGTPLVGMQPVLQHYDAAAGGWTPAINPIYTPASPAPDTKVCATFTSLSPFALLVPLDTAPPSVTISVTPSSLWPANGKMVDVTVRGMITDAGSGIDASTARFAVTDTYGQMQPSGPVSVAADGSYAFTILLRASRNGTDLGGRTYTVTVSIGDRAGNAASISAVVTVPHDQAK